MGTFNDQGIGDNSPTPENRSPAIDLASVRPLVKGNGNVAYLPSASWSGVPGVGTSNLALIPDEMVSPLYPWQGYGVAVTHPLVATERPFGIRANYQVLQGVGGVQSGSTALQPLGENQFSTSLGE